MQIMAKYDQFQQAELESEDIEINILTQGGSIRDGVLFFLIVSSLRIDSSD